MYEMIVRLPIHLHQRAIFSPRHQPESQLVFPRIDGRVDAIQGDAFATCVPDSQTLSLCQVGRVTIKSQQMGFGCASVLRIDYAYRV